MANAFTISILVILFCLSAAAAARMNLYPIKGQDDSTSALSPSANDGICKLMVEPQGYVCQEHMVLGTNFNMVQFTKSFTYDNWLYLLKLWMVFR